MLSRKKFLSSVLSVLVVLSILFGITSCFDAMSTPSADSNTKEDIAENVNNAEKNNIYAFNYVADFLIEWGFPEFDRDKVTWVESAFYQHLVFEGGLSPEKYDTLTRAVALARLYLAGYYDNTDLSDKTAVTDSIISALVELSGDPYSAYRILEDTNKHEEDMSGRFGGIGVLVEYNDDDCTIMVSEVNLDSPAERAGIKVGDIVYSVDGLLVSEIGHRNAVYYVRGEVGTEVTLVMLRGDELLEFVCTRALVEDRTVGYGITEDNLGYIQITSFKSNTDEQFIKAVDDLLERGIKGLVIDVRNNLGGYVQTAVNMLSYILPSDIPLITYDYKSTQDRVLVSSTDKNSAGEELDSIINIPIVLLCNQYSASASEIFISVLRDYAAGGVIDLTTVGTVTYKKGVIQSTLLYPDGSTITLTSAYYYPPSGTVIHGVGITPDYVVENSETEDLQINKAFELLGAVFETEE